MTIVNVHIICTKHLKIEAISYNRFTHFGVLSYTYEMRILVNYHHSF